MKYRRFGKTELQIPVITCGGMRYQQSWSDIEESEVASDGQANLEATIRYAFDKGVNHIETARGYGSSEMQLGKILPQLPRDELIVQTKVPPKETEAEFMETFEKSMDSLNLAYVDMLSIHGINNEDVLNKTLNNGALDACRKIQKQGRARHIGFSTHGNCADVTKAIATDEFSYVNLHWYLFDQANEAAIAAAAERDMGVLIISPNDKGGMLYRPSAKLEALCAPLTPMAVNALFCLSDPRVHTLSMGVSKPSDFDAHFEALELYDTAADAIAPMLTRIQEAAEAALGKEWANHWGENLPFFGPGHVPLYHVLRLYNLVKAYDMVAFGKMRYNLLGNGGHWFAGAKVDDMQWDLLTDALKDYAFADRVPEALRECHELLNAEDQKRLSESD